MRLSVLADPGVTAQSCAPDGPDGLAELAVDALVFEARLTPKPCLVDAAGPGSHRDMDLALLVASAESLRPAFAGMTRAAGAGGGLDALRAEIGRIGRRGEAAMLETTGGVNTHRGALWALGLLVTGAARSGGGMAATVMAAARLAASPDPGAPARGVSHGEAARRTFGIGGASAEAAAGFPHVVGTALPVYRSACDAAGPRHAALDALLAVMTTLDDTCILHRGGRPALRLAQRGAADALAAGGAGTAAGMACLQLLDNELTARNISPGGSADLLAAALFVDALLPSGGGWRNRAPSPRSDPDRKAFHWRP